MSTEQAIQLYTAMFYACIAVTILGFGLAAFFFFRFDIPTVFALMTGRVKRKTIEKMNVSGDFNIGGETQTSGGQEYANIPTGQYMTEKMGMGLMNDGVTEPIENSRSGEQVTTLLSGSEETEELEEAAVTRMLYAENDVTVTTVLNESGYMEYDQFNKPIQSTDLEPGTTEVLTEERQKVPAGRFEVIEHIMLIHSDEDI